MAQHDYDINSSDSISGLQFRQDVNAVLSAIKSSNSGATAPTTYVPGTPWLDTSTTPHIPKKRNTTNTGWDIFRIEDALGTAIASATTTTVGTYSGGNTVHITGTTTITSLGVSTTGTTRTLIFDSALTITHNATSLILLGGADILTVAGSIANFVCEDGALGYWRCTAISHSAVSMAELLYISTLTSDAQTQLNAKAPLASPTFTGTPTAPTAVSGTKNTQVATTEYSNSLLSEHIVTSNAVTSIDFSGLDINTHKSYRVEIELVNATASSLELFLFVNGDVTNTNYYSQSLSIGATVVSSERTNNARIGQLAGSSSSNQVLNLALKNLYPSYISTENFGIGSAVQLLGYAVTKTATVANITQLTFTSSVALSIGVGSKIRIYRGDV